jgi:hypothetical protein
MRLRLIPRSVDPGPNMLCAMADLTSAHKISESRSLLSELRFDDRGSQIPALALLALAGLGPNDQWSQATAPLLTVKEVMAWIRDHYGIDYSPNTRETVRQNALLPFIELGISTRNPDNPDRPVNAPRTVYQLQPDVLPVIKSAGGSELGRAARQFLDKVASAEALGQDLASRTDVDAVLTGLTSQPSGLIAAEAAVIRRRRALIAELRKLAVKADSTESDMQKILEKRHWIFGGQYTGIAERRDLMPMQQHDIPLVAADLSLTIAELKSPGAALTYRPRKNHLVVSKAVNDAVGQCMNYLRTLDEMGLALRTLHHDEQGLEYDYRRARAIVIIGHPGRPGKTATAPSPLQFRYHSK